MKFRKIINQNVSLDAHSLLYQYISHFTEMTEFNAIALNKFYLDSDSAVVIHMAWTSHCKCCQSI